jgi:hypothetical protein
VIEKHRFGLFAKRAWISMLKTAGCQAVIAEPVDLGDEGFPTGFVFVGRVTGRD